MNILKKNWPLHFGTGISTVKLTVKFEMFSLYSNYEDHGASDADSCDFYGTVDETHGCHIDKFPTETMEDLFGDNVSKCCTFHGYTMHDNCEVSNT